VDLPEFGRDPYDCAPDPRSFADSRAGNGNAQGIPQQVGPAVRMLRFSDRNQVQAIRNGQRFSANDYMLDGAALTAWSGAVPR